MLEQFDNIEQNYNVELKFIELKNAPGKPVPVLVCDRNLVLMYFGYVKTRDELFERLQSIAGDEIDYAPTLKVYRELKARIDRLEKSIYFECEQTGELRLFSSLVIFEDKIVHTKVVRDKVKLEKKQQAKIDLKKKQEEYARARRGKTELELDLMDGKITEDQVKEVMHTITREEWIQECKNFVKDGHTMFMEDPTDAKIGHICWHRLLRRRVIRKQIERETDKKMEMLNSMFHHPVVQDFIAKAYEGREERLKQIEKRKAREASRSQVSST